VCKPCRCHSDNVSINPKEFVNNLVKRRPDLKNNVDIKNFKNWLKTIEDEEDLASSDESVS
jgi:hypothetical protein